MDSEGKIEKRARYGEHIDKRYVKYREMGGQNTIMAMVSRDTGRISIWPVSQESRFNKSVDGTV